MFCSNQTVHPVLGSYPKRNGVYFEVEIVEIQSLQIPERLLTPIVHSQETADAGVRELFQAYEVHYMTKLFAPRQEKVNEEGNHHYCFVELENEAQTDDAIKELDWMEVWGWKVRVKLATKTGTTKPEGDQTWRGSKPFDSLRKNEWFEYRSFEAIAWRIVIALCPEQFKHQSLGDTEWSS